MVKSASAMLIIETLEKQYWDAVRRKNESHRIFLANAVVLLARSPKSRIAVDLLNVVYCEIQHEDKRLPVPDYALDMHTPQGKGMKRGIDHFFQEGAKLVNAPLPNPYTEKAWAMLKKHGGLKSAFGKEESVK